MPEPSLKVLFVADRFEVRGSSAYTLRLAEGLRSHGWTVSIITPNADRIEPARRQRLAISIHPQLNVPLWGQIVRESVVRTLASDPPDLIHIQSWNAYRNGVWLARRLQRPYILSVHDYLPPHAHVRFDLQWGRRIIAVSQSVKSE